MEIVMIIGSLLMGILGIILLVGAIEERKVIFTTLGLIMIFIGFTSFGTIISVDEKTQVTISKQTLINNKLAQYSITSGAFELLGGLK